MKAHPAFLTSQPNLKIMDIYINMLQVVKVQKVKVYLHPHFLATQFPSVEVTSITGFFYVVPEIFQKIAFG